MPHPLRYRYKKGETLFYDIYVTHEISETADEEALTSLMAIRSSTFVEVAEPDRFVCRVSTEVKGAEGLAETESPVDTSQVVYYSHDARGRSKPVPGHPNSFEANIAFPDQPLEPGDYWEYTDPGPDGRPSKIEVQLDEFLQQGDDLIAVVSTKGVLNLADPEASGSLSSIFHFSITRGRRLWSKTEIENVWNSGRRLQSVVEAHYEEPTT